MDFIEDEFIKSGLVKSKHWFNRYLKLIRFYKELSLVKKNSKKGEYERHHILPSAIWPDYKKSKQNIVVLPTYIHFIAHYLLYKSINHASCVYSFNQMNRVVTKLGITKAKMYEKVRIELANLISEINTGKKMSPEGKKRMSDITKGTNIYRHKKTGEMKRMSTSSVEEEWEPFQTGRIRTDESKTKTSNKMKNRQWQYNPLTKESKFDFILNQGFVFGIPPWHENNSVIFKEYKWAFDEKTGKNIRCRVDDIPSSFTIGRKYDNKGILILNDPNTKLVLDVIDMKYKYVKLNELSDGRYVAHGKKIEDIFVFSYKGKTFYSWIDVMKNFPELPKIKCNRDLSILNERIPKKHYNQTKARQEFCDTNHGKTFSEIGLTITKLKDNK